MPPVMPESLPVTLSNKTLSSGILKHLHGFLLNNAYTSSLPHLPITLSAPLSLLTFIRFLTTTPPLVLYALQTTLTCCPFLVFALHLPPVVSVLLPPVCGTRSHLAFATLPLPIPSVAFLKPLLPAVFRLPLAAHPSASYSASGWHCALWTSIYLFIYLLNSDDNRQQTIRCYQESSRKQDWLLNVLWTWQNTKRKPVEFNAFFMKLYTWFGVHFGRLVGYSCVVFEVVSGVLVVDVDEERGTERNELEERPASDEWHAARQVVTIRWWWWWWWSQLIHRITTRLISINFMLLVLLLTLFTADMFAPFSYSTLLLRTCV